jgi:hypothetical protein
MEMSTTSSHGQLQGKGICVAERLMFLLLQSSVRLRVTFRIYQGIAVSVLDTIHLLFK